MNRTFVIFAVLFFFTANLIFCHSVKKENNTKSIQQPQNAAFDTTFQTIHIFVALCDNKYQGIVLVPKSIGNGQNPSTNLYWGCDNGIKSYFKRSKEWKLVSIRKMDSVKMERIIFKHISKKYYLIADAYNGKYIKTCTEDFLKSSCGEQKDTVHIQNNIIGIAGNAVLLSYIGHDGLMDFNLTETYKNTDNKKRNTIILACYSKHFFSPHLKSANIHPLLWTTNLMCPEAYTVHDAISAFINKESAETLRGKAAKAYSRYQKCSEKAARNLLVTGW